MTAPEIRMADVNAALAVIACDDGKQLSAEVVEGELHVTVPSVGAAMLFASAFTVRMIAAAQGTGLPGAAAGLAAEVMSHASDRWDPPDDIPGMLTVYFPGIRITAPAVTVGDRVAYTVTYGGLGEENHIQRTEYGRVTSIRPAAGARCEDKARIAVEAPRPGRAQYVERYLSDVELAPQSPAGAQ